MSFLLNSDRNKIGDRGCRYISGGGWLRVKVVGMRIHRNISENCDVREEGCRAMVKQQGHPERLYCILVVSQVNTIKSEWPAPTS